MNRVYIFDPSSSDKLSQFRGGGRIIQILKENLPDAEFITNLDDISNVQLLRDRAKAVTVTLLISSWQPFFPPLLSKRIADKQYLIIYDVIPLKYPEHFPSGIRGTLNLLRNKQALKHFDKIITISETSKKDIIKYLKIPAEKVEVIYPSLTKVFINSKYEIRNSKQILNSKIKSQLSNVNGYMLYVGDVNWNKNLVNLAKAIKIADVPCIFVGRAFEDFKNWRVSSPEGVPNGVGISNTRLGTRARQAPPVFNHIEQQDFKSFLELAKDDKHFIFAGFVPDADLLQLYKRAVCNILVSRDEGFGLSYLEAASQNCPSILSDINIFHEIANNTALFANPENPEEIAKKIREMSNPATTEQPIFDYSQSLKKYSPENFRKKINSLLKNPA